MAAMMRQLSMPNRAVTRHQQANGCKWMTRRRSQWCPRPLKKCMRTVAELLQLQQVQAQVQVQVQAQAQAQAQVQAVEPQLGARQALEPAQAPVLQERSPLHRQYRNHTAPATPHLERLPLPRL